MLFLANQSYVCISHCNEGESGARKKGIQTENRPASSTSKFDTINIQSWFSNAYSAKTPKSFAWSCPNGKMMCQMTRSLVNPLLSRVLSGVMCVCSCIDVVVRWGKKGMNFRLFIFFPFHPFSQKRRGLSRICNLADVTKNSPLAIFWGYTEKK